MDLKISEAICAGDQGSSDVLRDFLYQVDKWSKSSQIRKTTRSTRKNQQIQPGPDQRVQPFIPMIKKRHTSTTSKPNRNIVFSNQNQKSDDNSNEKNSKSEISKFPTFNLVNELPLQIIPISTIKTTSAQSSNLRRSSSSKLPNFGQLYQTNSNPLMRLLICEKEIEKLGKEKIEQQKLLRESQNKIIHQIVMPKVNTTEKQNSQTHNKPVLLSDDYYYSKLVDHGQWSVIWDVNKITNIPLILDRSDKYIAFTDSNSNENNSGRRVREWNNLNLLSVKQDYYSPMKSETQTNDDKDIHHSEIATSLALVEPHITDFEHFHHPVFDPPLDTEMTITHLHQLKKTNKNDSPYLNTVESLSGKNGDIYVIEHTVENPPFIVNIGMNSLLITYWFKEKENDISSFTDDFIKTLKILEPNEQSPFIAQLPRNKPVQAIYCPLYRMPIAKHVQNETDFLLIKDLKLPKFYIRRFDDIFCAGMLEPQKEVMTPGSKTTQKFQDNFMNAVLINIFRGTPVMEKREHVIVSQIQHAYFPEANEQKLRQLVKKYAEFTREQGNGYWKFKSRDIDLESDFNQLGVSPESVCSYQSMLVGQWRLRQNGVSILKTEPRLYMQIKRLKGERTKLIAEKIDLELMKTPWVKTKSFTGAFQSNAIEMQNADGETVYRKKSRRQKASDNPEAAAKKKRKLFGTEADLRSLSLEQLEQLLTSLNVPREKFQDLARWKKVDLVRQIANRQQQDNPNAKVSLYYARERNGYQEICNKYKQRYQQTFENNLNFISTPAEEKDEEKDNFDDGDLLDELEREMMHNEQNEEEDDELFETEQQADQNQTQDSQAQPKPKPKFQSSGDPKELVPYGICTYPTKIDWASYGFDPKTYSMRPVVKLIHVSLDENGVEVHVEWKRSPHEIKETRKKPTVFQEIGPQVMGFNESILMKRKKEIQEKLRRRNQKKSKNGKVQCLGYIPSHTFLLVHEDGNGQFSFELTPEVVKQINEAREIYQDYERGGRSSHFTVSSYSNLSQFDSPSFGSNMSDSKSASNLNSSSSSSASSKKQGQSTTTKKRSIDTFNDELKKIISERGKDSFLKFYSIKDSNSNSPDGVKMPSLKALVQKCEKRGYKSVSDFMNDIAEFKSFYKDRDPADAKKADEMYSEFKSIMETNKIIVRYDQQKKMKKSSGSNVKKESTQKKSPEK